MFPNRNQGQTQPQPQQPINLYRPGIDPRASQGPAVQAPTSAPKFPTQFLDEKKIESSKNIIILVLAVIAVIFAGLFVWKFLDWSSVNSTIDYKVEQRVADEEREIEANAESKCNVELNSETATFLGPKVYGSLTFEYPKVWSVYIERDESAKNGVFNAYLNPSSVGPIAEDSVFAVRVTIQNSTLAEVTASYNAAIEEGTMSSSIASINGGSSSATVYISADGTKKTAVFQIPDRNQVAIISTDSVKNFGTYFQSILNSIEIDK